MKQKNTLASSTLGLSTERSGFESRCRHIISHYCPWKENPCSSFTWREWMKNQIKK